MKKYLYIVIGIITCVLLPAQYAQGSIIGFESLPEDLSTHVSRHGVNGPVLADDFASAFTGRVKGVEWWGAAPQSGGTDLWEATFHGDTGGMPDTTFPSGVSSQHFLNAAGTDIGGGIFHYQADWSPADMFITANTSYWFSIANASGSNWTWANGAPASVGSEFFAAMVSTGVGPNGGPHFGAWNAIFDAPGVPTNFAFRIIVPEPFSLALIGIGLIGIAFANRRRKTAA